MLFFFKQKTAYEMRISDWSSDVCSSDLILPPSYPQRRQRIEDGRMGMQKIRLPDARQFIHLAGQCADLPPFTERRSEEHTSELQSLMRISYAVFCLKKKTYTFQNQINK